MPELPSEMRNKGPIKRRDANGVIIREQGNISLRSDEPTKLVVNTQSLTNAQFYIVQFTSDEGIVIFDKFIQIE